LPSPPPPSGYYFSHFYLNCQGGSVKLRKLRKLK
jgi:hypothetical protein